MDCTWPFCSVLCQYSFSNHLPVFRASKISLLVGRPCVFTVHRQKCDDQLLTVAAEIPAKRRLPDFAVALGRSATEFRQEFQLGSLARVRERQQGGHPWPVVPHASDPLPLRGPRHMSSFVSVVIGTSVGGRDRQAGVHSRGRALLRKSPGSAVRSNRDFHVTCATSHWIMRALPHVPVGLPRRLPRKSAYSCTTIGRHSLRTYICKPAICATVCVLYPPYSIAVFSPTRTHSATTHNHAS